MPTQIHPNALEEEVQRLETDLTLAKSKLNQMAVYGEIQAQRLIIRQLERQKQEAEDRLGIQRGINAAAYEHEQRFNQQVSLSQQLTDLESRIAKATGLIQAMKTEIENCVRHKNVILQQLAELKQQGVN